MGVSKNRGITKWINFINGKTYEQMDDLGGFPIIFGGPPKCSFADDFSVDFILPISYH